jgi:hypothetical protein
VESERYAISPRIRACRERSFPRSNRKATPPKNHPATESVTWEPLAERSTITRRLGLLPKASNPTTTTLLTLTGGSTPLSASGVHRVETGGKTLLEGVYCLDLNNADTRLLPEFDVVFVHGLSSSADSAWKNSNGDLWPLWLKATVTNSRVLLLNYPAPSLFTNRHSGVTIQERARNLADFLPTIGIGNRPTVFVCHSLGGILIKEIIRCCIETDATSTLRQTL